MADSDGFFPTTTTQTLASAPGVAGQTILPGTRLASPKGSAGHPAAKLALAAAVAIAFAGGGAFLLTRDGGAADALPASPAAPTPANPAAVPALPAPPAAIGGAGVYLGSITNSSGGEVPVSVTLAADLTSPPSADANDVRDFMAAVSQASGAPIAGGDLRFALVEVDNRGKTEVAYLPEPIDVLDAAGTGAAFMSASAMVSLAGDTFEMGHPLHERGIDLYNRLLVESFEVRPGQVETVLYVSPDAIADVATVLVGDGDAKKVK